MTRHPDLGADLAELPWEAARETTLPEFLDRYTLHDSGWLRLECMPDRYAIAVFAWDTYWTSGRIPYRISEATTGPLLLIGFDILYLSAFNGADVASDTVDYAECREVLLADVPSASLPFLPVETTSAMQRERLLHHTVIHDVVGGRVDLFHGAHVKLLCLGDGLRPFSIPWERPPDDPQER